MCFVKKHCGSYRLRCSSYVTIYVVLMLQFGYNFADIQNCDGDCLKCGKSGCVKCSNFIVYPSRICVASCPSGYRSRWSHLSEYMGRICVRRDTFLGISNDTLTILTGITTGTCFCIIVVAAALLYLNYKRRLWLNMSSEMGSDTDTEASPEQRKEFVKQLDTLRPYAYSFLDILNDTRKQLRESWHRDGTSVLAVYRPIVRDLAKILLLLNRPVNETNAVPPDDWEHLYAWAEKTLRRCKRLSTTSSDDNEIQMGLQPVTGQLINFLQGDNATDMITTTPTTMTVLSTFKPMEPQVLEPGDPSNGTATTFTNHGSTNGSNSPREWQVFDNYGHSQFNPTIWKSHMSSKENLHNAFFLQDDDFLGYRPQDEITTEL